MIAGAVTHTGRVRTGNEDAYYVPGQVEGLYVVADGMGGHNAGEVASRLAVAGAVMEIRDKLDSGNIPEMLCRAVSRVNEIVFTKGESNRSMNGMGTTLTLALFRLGKLYVAHVGDSRAYLLGGGEFRQVTRDHTLLQELLQMGELSQEEALSYPHRHVITRALGTEYEIEPDVFELDVASGDTLLICSDGLTDHVDNEEIASALRRGGNPQALCETLLELALSRGGKDNITIVIVRLEGGNAA